MMVSSEFLGKLPSIDEIKNPQNIVASVLYTDDYVEMGKFYIENRTILTFNQISPHTVNALISTEDVRFRDHAGIDVYGMSSAVFRTFLLGKRSGASTITQQLAKNLFHSTSKNVFLRSIQKIKEWYIAVQLESNFSKDEIVALYLNTVPFLHNSFGLREASMTYFSKEPIDLSIEESATLIGMLKGPGLYNPKTNPENALKRRNVVLDQMAKNGFLSVEKAEKLKDKPITLHYNLTSPSTGIAPYLREQIRIELNDILKNYSNADGKPYNIYTDGLRIYTTIDSKIQEAADNAVNQHMPWLQNQFIKEWGNRDPYRYGAKANPDLILDEIRNSEYYALYSSEGKTEDEILKILSKKEPRFMYSISGAQDMNISVIDSMKYMKKILQVGLCAMDPTNGKIKAWVGGINFNYFKYDHVRASTKRQVGSTIKPFLYTLAIQNGENPCTEVDYVRPDIPGFENWDPKGSGQFADGSKVMLKDALQVSDNRVAALLIKQYMPSALIDLCKMLGIDAQFDNVPAIALGTTDISVIEMLGAYSPYMNQGIESKPYYIERIEDKNGNVIYENKPQSKEVLSQRTAQIMNVMMQQVSKPPGTAGRLRTTFGMKFDIACKTGTTQSNSDGWFIGSTPGLLTAIWVGADDPSITFASTSLGQGASSALPMWGKMYKTIYSDLKSMHIDKGTTFFSDSMTNSILDCNSYATPLFSDESEDKDDLYESN